MGEAAIQVSGVTKTFRVVERQEGVAASLASLFRRSRRIVEAVRDITFTIPAGEMVGFIGPNGAGKTTTLKMLSGLLHPTSGDARVLGFTPWQRKPEYLRRISMVMGNKSQLVWDIPPMDTYRVLAEIYELAPGDFQSSLGELTEMLSIGDLLKRQVRTLSLGERMKCELAAGLLHRPRVLFLDEPTLGLDVSTQARLRRFLAEYRLRHGVTTLLTSHYMADVTALCRRVIFIHQGGLLYDGGLTQLAERLAPFKLIRLTLDQDSGAGIPVLPAGVELVERESGRLTLRVGRAEAPGVTAQLLAAHPVADLSVEDPPIEAVIDRIYQGGAL